MKRAKQASEREASAHEENSREGNLHADSTARGLAKARVLITRAVEDQAALAGMIRARGGIPVAFPCIEFAPPEDATALDAALDRLVRDPPAAVALASAHAVESFGKLLRARAIDPSSALAEVLIAVAGEGSARAVDWEGAPPISPREGAGAAPLAQALIEALRARELPFAASRRVLIPQAAEANPALAESLRLAGLEVETVALYRTLPVASISEEHEAGLTFFREREIDLILFASGSAARAFVGLIAKHSRGDSVSAAAAISGIIGPARVVCMGAACAETARSLGLEVAAIGEAGFDSLLDAAAACYSGFSSDRSDRSGERAP